jgi:hypothetical protein
VAGEHSKTKVKTEKKCDKTGATTLLHVNWDVSNANAGYAGALQM